MRKIKGSSSYLKNQVQKKPCQSWVLAQLYLQLFSPFWFTRILFTLQFGILEDSGFSFLACTTGCFLLLSAQVPHLQRRLARRKTSRKPLNSHIERRLFSLKRLVPARRRRRYRSHRFGTQWSFRFGDQELERKHFLQRRRMATTGQTQFFRKPKSTG